MARRITVGDTIHGTDQITAGATIITVMATIGTTRITPIITHTIAEEEAILTETIPTTTTLITMEGQAIIPIIMVPAREATEAAVIAQPEM
jgi:hypothetical protein